MSGARSVGAEFKLTAKPKFLLKVGKTGTGTGKVTGPGIDCGSTCEAEYEEGTKVTLTQAASAGSKFTEWSGACTGTGTCEVTMSAAKEVSAKFDLVPKFKLSVSKSGTGQGTVTSIPAGISCGATCSFEYEAGKEVELKETPEAGSEFKEWLGACSGAGSCKVTMSEAREVTAIFEAEEVGPLDPTLLKVARFGEGTVTSSPAGIVCGSECEGKFETGSTVTLTASPATGYAFSAWAGCTEHVGLTCKVLMDKAKTVKVTFVATPSLTIEKSGTGQGKVGATGISCDENCTKAESTIKAGTSVTIKTTPAKGSEAAVISGTGSASACSGSTCTFTISEKSSVTVKFAAIPTHKLTVSLGGPAAYKGKVSGKGTVKGLTASAINCGAGCTLQTESFFATDEVTLSAVAGTGYTFAGWSGEEAGTCTGTTSPCTIPMSANKSLGAKFK
jgi:uncharacterized repeat protein (TIGR02543 family)